MNLLIDWAVVLEQYGSAAARILLAALLGGLLGFEREWRGREAGLRTNMMIAVAAALFTYLGVEEFPLGEGVIRDPARVAAQIVSGVGFLGAGTLLVHRNKVRGLTTAATIWLVAAVGMAVGAGAYFSAIFTTLVALLVLVVLAPISRKLEQRVQARARQRRATEALQEVVEHPEKDEAFGYWLEEETD